MSAPAYAVVTNGAVVEYRSTAPNVDQSLLAPGKPRILPVVEVNADYDSISQVREGPVITVEGDRVVYTYNVRAKNADEITAMRNRKLVGVRAIAEQKIFAIMPDFAQRNALALGLQLVTTLGQFPSGWPEEDQAKYSAISDAWGRIKSIRNISNTKEAEIVSLTSPSEIDAYDINAGW